MGKVAGAGNRPTNASLSYALPHLRTYVEITPSSAARDSWEPLARWPMDHEAQAIRAEDWDRPPRAPAASPGEATGSTAASATQKAVDLAPLALAEKGRARFLAHLQALKDGWGYRGSFVVRSGNGFPSDCGLASSASSFAALTTAAASALVSLTGSGRPRAADLAELSRRGSGSSCRSFFAPWALWTEAGALPLDLPARDLIHQTIVVSDLAKAVSSSEAHARVLSSALFDGRPARASFRLGLLIAALSGGAGGGLGEAGWRQAYAVAWAEFWDMHALFETSAPPFGYMAPGSLEAALYARDELWGAAGDGPIVTMDAGANVHFLFRRDQSTLAQQAARDLGGRFRVIASE
jgi:diphosphomevalonate decarboxylase